jgi:uncharacterized Zn finger protein
MNKVKYDRKWEINTFVDYFKAMEILDENEFVADMADDFNRCFSEKAEIDRQRADVRTQAAQKGLISENEDKNRRWNKIA